MSVLASFLSRLVVATACCTLLLIVPLPGPGLRDRLVDAAIGVQRRKHEIVHRADGQ